MGEGYFPDFDHDFSVGKRGEALVGELRAEWVAGKVEVKYDRHAHRTGNIYIEFECRRADGWQPSGIATTKATHWAYVVASGPLYFVLPTPVLRSIAEGARRRGQIAEERDGSHPTKGALVPILAVVRWSGTEVAPPPTTVSTNSVSSPLCGALSPDGEPCQVGLGHSGTHRSESWVWGNAA
jgi:hypothetical protein